MNTVNEQNFNETCKGYLKKAIQIMHEADADYSNNMTVEQEKRLRVALGWAFSEMSFEDARRLLNE